MDEHIKLVPQEEFPIELVRLKSKAEKYIADHLADSTKRAYKSDWERYEAWCDSFGMVAIPARPEAIAIYMASLVDLGLSVATIERALAAIAKAHEVAKEKFDRKHDFIRQALMGIKRELGEHQEQVDAVMPADLKKMIEAMPKGARHRLRNLRNRAMLTLGLSGGFRRSELVSLDVEDLDRTEDGYRVFLAKSKTDQTGAGREIGIPYGGTPITCPVRSIDRWLDVASLDSGALLCGVSYDGMRVLLGHRLNDKTIARTVKRAALRAGIEGRFAGHSLRAGLVTAAARSGKSVDSIQAQTGHKSLDMIMRYIRREGLFDDNAAAGIGL
jgi:site-specific recombinase XerD